VPLLELLGYSTTFWSLLVALIIGHVFADHVFQNNQMSLGKDHKAMTAFGEPYETMWPLFLTSHSIINGTIVGIITGSFMLAVAETIAHWIIDYAKNERNDYGYITDQYLHIGCKVAWAFIATSSWFKVF
jgi:hypothetical protein